MTLHLLFLCVESSEITVQYLTGHFVTWGNMHCKSFNVLQMLEMPFLYGYKIYEGTNNMKRRYWFTAFLLDVNVLALFWREIRKVKLTWDHMYL